MQTLIQKVWNPGEMVLLTEPQAKSTPAVQRPLKKEALQFGERLAPEGSRKRSADLTHPRVPGLGPNPSTLTILTFKAEPLGTRILGVIRYPRPPPRPALQPHGGAARPPARIWGERARARAQRNEHARARRGGRCGLRGRGEAPARDRRLRGRASLASLRRPLRLVHSDRPRQAQAQAQPPAPKLVLLGCRGDPAPGPRM